MAEGVREHHLTARALRPLIDPKPTPISYSYHPSSSQFSPNYSSGNLEPAYRHSRFSILKKLESVPQSRLSSGTATPFPTKPARACCPSASALTQFAEHVESDRGEMGRQYASSGRPLPISSKPLFFGTMPCRQVGVWKQGATAPPPQYGGISKEPSIQISWLQRHGVERSPDLRALTGLSCKVTSTFPQRSTISQTSQTVRRSTTVMAAQCARWTGLR